MNFFSKKYLEFLSKNLWAYSLDIILCACKRICLDGRYLLVIFNAKVGEKFGN